MFRESCSRHVYRVTAECGFCSGLRAMLRRFRACRPGYSITTSVDVLQIRLVDGTTITREEASPTLLAPYSNAADRLQNRLNQTAR